MPILPDVRTSDQTARSFNNPVKVVVGISSTAQNTFYVPESIIAPRSIFFAQALNQTSKEAQERVIFLEHEKPDIFQIYLNLVFFNHIPIVNVRNEPSHISLCELWALCDTLQDVLSKDVVLSAIVHHSYKPWVANGKRHYPNAEAVRVAYERTPEDSQLRKMMVEFYFYHGDREWIHGDSNMFPPEFYRDLAVRLYERRIEGNLDNNAAIRGNLQPSLVRETTEYDMEHVGREGRELEQRGIVQDQGQDPHEQTMKEIL